MRIVQDSEDEDDLEIEGTSVDAQLGDALPNHSSHNDSIKPGEKGTGSTGMCGKKQRPDEVPRLIWIQNL